MNERGYRLDFSIDSLRVEVDRLLEAPDLFPARDERDEAKWRNEASLEAYVGETLARSFSGVWSGTFRADSPGANFYTSRVVFGDYRYAPSHFLAYRIANGAEQGSFAEHLEALLPKLTR